VSREAEDFNRRQTRGRQQRGIDPRHALAFWRQFLGEHVQQQP